MSSESVRARLEAGWPAVETRAWLRSRVNLDSLDLELALDVIKALDAAVADFTVETWNALMEARDRWEAGT